MRSRQRNWVIMRAIASSESPSLGEQPVSWVSGRDLIILLIVFLAYTLAGRCNVYLINLRPPAGSIWAPAGIALAAVLLQGRRVAPAIFLGTVVVGRMSSLPWQAALALATGNTAEILIGFYLVKRFAGGAKAFSRPADFLRYCLLAGGVATSVSAIVGATVLSSGLIYPKVTFSAGFIAWWAGDALAVLVITPFLVLLLNGAHHPLHLREFAEIGALLLGLSIVCVLSFGPPSLLANREDSLVLLCIPFLAWAAIRFCPLEAAGASMVLCGFATWGSLHGYGPFADFSVLSLPLAAYLCIATGVTLTWAATVASQREFSEQLLENLYRMEQSKDFEISHLTSELDFFRDELTRRVHAKSGSVVQPQEAQSQAEPPHPISHDVIWFLDAETENILYVSPSYQTVWGRSLVDLKRDPHDWLDAVVPEDREYAIAFVGQDFPGDRVETTYRIQRPDGSIRWIFDRGFVVREPSGRPVRYLGVASDITELVAQGEVVPLQLENRPAMDLREGEAGTQLRRKKE